MGSCVVVSQQIEGKNQMKKPQNSTIPNADLYKVKRVKRTVFQRELR